MTDDTNDSCVYNENFLMLTEAVMYGRDSVPPRISTRRLNEIKEKEEAERRRAEEQAKDAQGDQPPATDSRPEAA